MIPRVMHRNGLSPAALVIALLFVFAHPTTTAQTGSLPELGDAAARFLDPDDEALIGKRFLRELVAMEDYIADHELRHYLNSLGRRIGGSADLGALSLEFNLIRENELNAFAVPGGFITFNSGLLLTTESESELASVIGHEIAHLSQRHLPRMVAKAEASKIPTTAAIIASILVGGQAGMAGVTLANATLLSNQLAYSREFEREADAIGIGLMANSGFDPRAMSAFFDKLQRFNIVSSKDVPEFLRSHPLSYNRVAESEARISSYPPREHASSIDFHLARARILALFGDPRADARQTLRDRVDRSDGEVQAAWQYGLALALSADRQHEPARQLIEEVVDALPDVPQVLSARADIIRHAGDPDEAADILGALVDRFPAADFLVYSHLEALLEADRATEAKKVARYHLRRQPGDRDAYPLLSRANVALGALAEAHQADAEHHAAFGRYEKAIESLKLALRENADSSDYLSQAVRARLQEIERAAADIKARQKQ